jgi:hypothetical protein
MAIAYDQAIKVSSPVESMVRVNRLHPSTSHIRIRGIFTQHVDA